MVTLTAVATESFARGLGSAALLSLSLDARPRMMVSRDLRVPWSNNEAREQLTSETGVLIRNEVLTFTRPLIQRRFHDFLSGLGNGLGSLALQSEHGRGVLLFRGLRLLERPQPLACIEFTRDDATFRARYFDVDTVFGLTPAEHRIVQMLLAGQTASAIAESSGQSVGTVRTHVRHIYCKIEVSSREELISRLAPYRMV